MWSDDYLSSIKIKLFNCPAVQQWWIEVERHLSLLADEAVRMSEETDVLSATNLESD